MNASRGRLIVFEGVDASGKTTLCNELLEFLRREHKTVRLCHFPGKQRGTLGELVYRIHHLHNLKFGVPTIDPCSLQLLHIAAHVDTIESEIKPALHRGEWVILDRFWWSTYIYGLDSGVQESMLRHMINIEIQAWGPTRPDIIFLVDSKVPLRNDEAHSLAWKRKREAYIKLADDEVSIQKNIRLETSKENHARHQALTKIMEAVATFT
jgi:thymidylate kinase